MRVLLLSADTYSLVSEQTGENLEGTTLFYLNNYREDSKQASGFKPTKISAPKSLFATISASPIKLPAMADISVTTKPGAQGKASLVLCGVDLVESVDLFNA